jgi:hypothetical protein
VFCFLFLQREAPSLAMVQIVVLAVGLLLIAGSEASEAEQHSEFQGFISNFLPRLDAPKLGATFRSDVPNMITIPRTREGVGTQERTKTGVGSKSRPWKQGQGPSDFEWGIDADASRQDGDNFHILLLNETFAKPRMSVPYAAGALQMVLDMPEPEALEHAGFANKQGFSCLGTWRRDDALGLCEALRSRDLSVRAVPGVRGKQPWQGSPANQAPDALPSSPEFSKFIAPTFKKVQHGNGASPFAILDDKPTPQTAQAENSIAFLSARGEFSKSAKDFDPPIIASKEEKQAEQKLLVSDSTTAISLSAIGVGLLALGTVLGIRMRRGLQLATASDSRPGPEMPTNMPTGNVMEMKSQDSDMNSAVALETRSPDQVNYREYGWGQQSSQNSTPLTACYAKSPAEMVAEELAFATPEQVYAQWGVEVQSATATLAESLVFSANDKFTYSVETVNESIVLTRNPGLGIELLEVANNDKGVGIVVVEGMVEGTSAAASALRPGDCISAVGAPGGPFQFVEATTWDDTVAALGAVAGDQVELVVKRLVKRPVVNVVIKYPNNEMPDETLRLFAGENLRRGMLTRGVKLNDPLARRFDDNMVGGDCGSGGACCTCAVSVISGREQLTPEKSSERQIMKTLQQPRFRLACKAAVGADLENGQEGELVIRVNPRQHQV